MTPYYEDDACTIYHGDCREILPSLGRLALILTDPPYGARIAAWDFEWPGWMEATFTADTIALIPGVMNLGKLGQTFAGLRYRWTLCARMVTPARSPLGFCYWNPCVIYAADGVVLNLNRPDTQDFPARHDQPSGHPSPKPLDVMRWFVECCPGATVVDPFMGSGTTLRAAKDCGRKSIGVELSEAYCEIAAKRLAQEVLAL